MQKFYLKTACIISLILLCLFGFSAKIYAQTEWDLLYTTNLSRIMSPSIDPDAYGIFYYNGNIYVSSATVYYPHSQYNEKGKLFKRKQTGDVWSLDESIVIPDISVGNMNFTGFTTVGDYLYGVNRSNTIYKIKLSTMIVEEKITTTLGQCIAIAFDPVRDAFWITDNNAN